MSAFLIDNGEVKHLDAITFDRIRELIGGYIEPVNTKHATLWCNEDGQPLGLPANGLATALWWHLDAKRKGQRLVGPVVVTGTGVDDISPVPADVVALLTDWRTP